MLPAAGGTLPRITPAEGRELWRQAMVAGLLHMLPGPEGLDLLHETLEAQGGGGAWMTAGQRSRVREVLRLRWGEEDRAPGCGLTAREVLRRLRPAAREPSPGIRGGEGEVAGAERPSASSPAGR